MNSLAEQNIIGSLLIDKEIISDLTELKSDMFTDAVLGRIFLEYQRAFDRCEDINPQIIVDNIQEYPNEFIQDLLKECLMNTTTSAECKSYADTVINTYKAHRLDLALSTVKVTPNNYKHVIVDLMQEFDYLRSGKQKTTSTFSEVVSEVKDKYFKEHEDTIDLGFEKLDNVLGGLMKGELILIGARPAVGKTAFVCQMITNMVESGKKVAFYSLEMSKRQLYERIIARKSGIDLQRIRKAINFLADEEERFTNANNELVKMENLYVTTGARTVSDIRTEVRNMDFDVIVIDYLQLLSVDDRYRGNRVSEVTELSRNIKLLAMELNIPIVCLSQLNRSSEKLADKEPSTADLRESGSLEQDAAQILLMWNVSDLHKGIKVAKNRQGNNGTVVFQFDGSKMNFEETNLTKEEASGFKKVEDDNPFWS